MCRTASRHNEWREEPRYISKTFSESKINNIEMWKYLIGIYLLNENGPHDCNQITQESFHNDYHERVKTMLKIAFTDELSLNEV